MLKSYISSGASFILAFVIVFGPWLPVMHTPSTPAHLILA